MTLKYQGFQIGQTIRAQDFEQQGNRCYIEGPILEVHPTGHNARGYAHYVIRITADCWDGNRVSEGGRIGDIGYIPMESTLDWEGRVTLITEVTRR
ncbi:MAG: hypothetical protein JWL65_2842 [Gammaproteobacteria bacterium]|nr:hypothetical protein [Gammaproteobacteria bacterium]